MSTSTPTHPSQPTAALNPPHHPDPDGTATRPAADAPLRDDDRLRVVPVAHEARAQLADMAAKFRRGAVAADRLSHYLQEQIETHASEVLRLLQITGWSVYQVPEDEAYPAATVKTRRMRIVHPLGDLGVEVRIRDFDTMRVSMFSCRARTPAHDVPEYTVVRERLGHAIAAVADFITRSQQREDELRERFRTNQA